MEDEPLPAPRRPPSLVEDLGVVGAVSIERQRLAWSFAGAFALSTPAWAGVDVAVLWCAAVVAVLFRLPLFPRVALTAGGVAVTCALVGVASALLRASDGWVTVFWAILGAGHAMILVWASAVARALRRHARSDDAERSSARLVIWTQEHPWRVVLGLVLLVGPCGALGAEAYAATRVRWSGYDVAHEEFATSAGSNVGLAVLIAAALQGRMLRIAEKLLPVLTLALVIWLGLARLVWRGTVPLDAIAAGAMGQFGVFVVTLLAAEWGTRLAVHRRAGPEQVAVVTLLAIVARAAAATVPCRVDRFRLEVTLSHHLIHLLHDLPFMVVGVVLAASTLRARSVVLVSVLYGVVEAGLLGAMGPREASRVPWSGCLAIRALACVNQTLFALAARRVRSMTVVPADHVLRADWAVDLARPR